MRLRFSCWVKGDLEEIGRTIAADSPRHAANFMGKLQAKLAQVGRNPQLYRLRPELGDEVRLANVGRYVILFRIEGESVRIVRVVHGGRDLGALSTESD